MIGMHLFALRRPVQERARPSLPRAMRLLGAVAAGFFIGVVPTALARAQDDPSTAVLQRENDLLRERIAQLESQLAHSRKRITDLEKQVAELQAKLAASPATPTTDGGSGAAPPAEQPMPVYAEIPADPMAGPDSLFLALKADYETRFKDMSFDSDAERKRCIAEVGAWARQAPRALRGSFEWIIEVAQVVAEREEATIEFRVIDPSSGNPCSDRYYTMKIPGRMAHPISLMRDRKLWVVKGMLAAKPGVNASRPDVGAFDTPRFIGPFAEFGFEVTPRSVQPYEAGQKP